MINGRHVQRNKVPLFHWVILLVPPAYSPYRHKNAIYLFIQLSERNWISIFPKMSVSFNVCLSLSFFNLLFKYTDLWQWHVFTCSHYCFKSCALSSVWIQLRWQDLNWGWGGPSSGSSTVVKQNGVWLRWKPSSWHWSVVTITKKNDAEEAVGPSSLTFASHLPFATVHMPFLINTLALFYNFGKSWKSDPGIIKASEEQKKKVKLRDRIKQERLWKKRLNPYFKMFSCHMFLNGLVYPTKCCK